MDLNSGDSPQSPPDHLWTSSTWPPRGYSQQKLYRSNGRTAGDLDYGTDEDWESEKEKKKKKKKEKIEKKKKKKKPLREKRLLRLK
ncbi:unnamed protein product [Pleuronectes platessa]|uniref:Uncharacterized protein n=1 Tax=Pleuronectes platessa TaxID=8262 RepID=A0A9N7Z538_PLEPL|nr:unnamed protein product [Pleuronectes platessa]